MLKVKQPSISDLNPKPTGADSTTHQQPTANTEHMQEPLTEELHFCSVDTYTHPQPLGWLCQCLIAQAPSSPGAPCMCQWQETHHPEVQAQKQYITYLPLPPRGTLTVHRTHHNHSGHQWIQTGLQVWHQGNHQEGNCNLSLIFLLLSCFQCKQSRGIPLKQHQQCRTIVHVYMLRLVVDAAYFFLLYHDSTWLVHKFFSTQMTTQINTFDSFCVDLSTHSGKVYFVTPLRLFSFNPYGWYLQIQCQCPLRFGCGK